MNELIELLEMQADLEDLITEAVGELTVGEYQQLQESGIFNEFGRFVVPGVYKAAKHGTELRNAAKGIEGAARLAMRIDKAKRVGKKLAVAGGLSAGVIGTKRGVQRRGERKKNDAMLGVYKRTGNAVTACKSRYSDPAQIKACTARLYAAAKAGKITKVKDMLKDKYGK